MTKLLRGLCLVALTFTSATSLVVPQGSRALVTRSPGMTLSLHRHAEGHSHGNEVPRTSARSTSSASSSSRSASSFSGARDCDPGRPQLTLVHAPGGDLGKCGRYPGQLPQMVQRVVSPAIDRKSSEPTLAITRRGTAFFPSSGVDTPGNYYQRTEIFRSRDLGRTWKDVTPAVALFEVPPITQDPFMTVDPVTDRVYSLDLRLDQQCSWLSWTDDEGKSWEFSTSVCNSNPPFEDHQMMFVGPATKAETNGYPNVVYYCAHDIVTSFTCVRSLDGGLTFDHASAHAEFNDGCTYTMLTGHGAASFADGTAYVPWGQCDKVFVTLSRDNGESWKTVVVDKSAGTSPEYFDSHEARIATDREGNAYLLWIASDGLPRLSISRDEGRSWTRPLAVAAPGVTATRFPSITGGAKGQIAFSYYGTDVKGGFDATPKRMRGASWHAWTGFSLNALSRRPVIASTTSNPFKDPVRRGPCVGRCPDDADDSIGGGVYDFLGTHIDPASGRVWISIVDVCNGKCGRPGGSVRDKAIPRGAVGVQVGGTFLGPAVRGR